jgi:molecular chaperone DnaJ
LHRVGRRQGTSPCACDACGGSGRLVSSRREQQVAVQQITTCPACQGRGKIIDDPCPECTGSGMVQAAESLRVTIPPGIEDRTALRVPGGGLSSPEPRGQDGDLFVIIRAAPDQRFERRGPHLWHKESITVADAVLGTMLPVPTLGSPVRSSCGPVRSPARRSGSLARASQSSTAPATATSTPDRGPCA